MIYIYIIIGVASYILLVWLILKLLVYVREKKYGPRHPLRLEEDEWKPTFKLEHKGMQLFHLDFEPNEKEVFYIENEYDEACNLFIQTHKDLIERKFAEKGFVFYYIPDTKLDRESLVKSIRYRYPQGISDSDVDAIVDNIAISKVKSDFLLNYMVKVKNRGVIKPGFAWFNRYGFTITMVETAIYDYIAFDGSEALDHPEEVLDEICQELGKSYSWQCGLYCTKVVGDDEIEADWEFDTETKKLLQEIKENVDKLRMKGVSEAIISQLVRTKPKLSRIMITNEFRLFLPEYQNKEVKMEPMIKSLYVLFLRHPEGICFKDLPDYRRELGFIYQAVRNKKNDIDKRMSQELELPIENESINKLTNPFENSINEKCTRVKEAFLQLMHETVAETYYITGNRGDVKRVKLPTEMIVWE